MAVVPSGQALYLSGISLTGFGVGIANGALVTSQQIAAQLLASASGAYADMADLVLTLGTGTTFSGGAPNFQATALISLVSAGASEVARAVGSAGSSQLFPFGNFSQEQLDPVAYTSTELIVVKNIKLPSSPFFAIGFLNNGGPTLPTTLAAKLYPSGWASG